MANTVDLSNLQEYYDDEKTFSKKLEEVAALIERSQHVIVFTGAGISTSASIPDFHGPNGVWTNQAKGVAPPPCVSLTTAVPTPCHKLLQELVASKRVKYIVSQNVDGLHRRSGIAREDISELHGNCFISVCWNCQSDYVSETEVHGGLHPPRTCKECHPRTPHFCHCTGAACPNCGHMLKDSIIHFGEDLPHAALEKAMEHASLADLCIVLGSSLTVSPANEIPAIVARRKKPLVIVNLQKTDLDKRCAVRVWGKSDDVAMRLRSLLLAFKK